MADNHALKGSPRERLLAAATELFYAEGVHTVGIDRVIERAGVAKASLYSTFGSKDELVRAYLQQRHETRKERISARLERCGTPRERLLAVFEVLVEQVAVPGYRGCAFVNASAEGLREGATQKVCESSRTWIRDLFSGLARELGAKDAEALAGQLMLLYDGAVTAAAMDRDPQGAHRALLLATALIDAAGRTAAASSQHGHSVPTLRPR